MTQTSVGFNGTISDLQLSRYMSLIASPTPGSPAEGGGVFVAAVAGQRQVTVSAGAVGGNGVATVLDAPETLAIPAPTNGQWFLVVLNRVWGSNTTSLQIRNGATTSTTKPTALPTSYPATFATNHGVNSDIALAWVWSNAANASPQGVATLVYPIAGRRGTTAQRDAIYGAPAELLRQLGTVGQRWYNTDYEYEEIYMAPRASAGTGDYGRPAGWFPISGHMPGFQLSSTALGSIPNNAFTDLGGYAAADRSNWGPGFNYDGSGFWNLGLPGRYLTTAQWSYPAQSASKRILRLATTGNTNMQAVTDNAGGTGSLQLSGEVQVAAAGAQMKLAALQNSGTAMTGSTLDYWRTVYLGPL